MTFDLSTFNWQSVSSLLTFGAVAIALWQLNAKRREDKARAGHILRMTGLMLIAFMNAFRDHLQEVGAAQTVKFTEPLQRLCDEILALFKEGFLVFEPKQYGRLAVVYSELCIFRAYDDFTRDAGQMLLDRIQAYLTNTLVAPELGPTGPKIGKR